MLWVCFGSFFLLLIMIVYGIWIEPYEVEVNRVEIRDEYLGKILADKVVVQLSDLHIQEIGTRERKIIDIINGLKPDIIFLTGDYVSWKGDYAPAFEFLALLQAKTGMWAVMGEYDYSRSRKSCSFCHEEGSGKPTQQHSVQFLRDRPSVISLRDGTTLDIAGMDEEGTRLFFREGRFIPPDSKRTMIILSHSPLNFDRINDDRNILMLAGDTHGGQIPLPSWLWHFFRYEKNVLYSEGLFKKGHRKMFVSRGIGTSHFPMRLFRRPEVVVLHFKE